MKINMLVLRRPLRDCWKMVYRYCAGFSFIVELAHRLHITPPRSET